MIENEKKTVCTIRIVLPNSTAEDAIRLKDAIDKLVTNNPLSSVQLFLASGNLPAMPQVS